MCQAKHISELLEAQKDVTSKYVHATSRGHEAVQLALGLQLTPKDWVSPYYRDDSILLGIGVTPEELFLQVLAKKNDPFSGGRTYYSHPSLNESDKPKIIHQSSATGMQAIPTTGIALGLQYKEKMQLLKEDEHEAVVICSLGDASCTEGEVSEAMQMAVLKKLPILYFVQDNGWDISANAAETRAQNIAEFAAGFKGMGIVSVDGSDFEACYDALQKIIKAMRKERRPFVLHATVPLLNHHTSGVRKEWYRDDLEIAAKSDPFPKLKNACILANVSHSTLDQIERES
ncbi:MAG: hypothetical protein RLZZ68_1869, partial [Bacteroidota bacterium]